VNVDRQRHGLQSWQSEPSETVPILMYHSVTAEPPRSTRALSVHPGDFAAQLAHLRSQGFTGFTFGDLCDRWRASRPLPQRPVVLTFDDGYADLLEEAMPAMTEHGFPATVFVTTGWVEDAGRLAAGSAPDRMLSWAQIAELSHLGVEIGTHSHTHPQLDQLSGARLRTELVDSRRHLEDRLGQPVCSLAYPYGYSNKRVREASQESGYKQAASVGNAAASPSYDPFRVPRLTIRRSTSLSAFVRIVKLERIALQYADARLLTAGWAVARRIRSLASNAVDRPTAATDSSPPTA
jgi:peptidoglycan/xylan/chitin deacetylase (PgdA/CDA1 family)